MNVAVTRKGPPKPADVISRISARLTPHEMRDPFDIGETLSRLAASGEPLTVYVSGADPILARVESVDPDQPHFVLDFSGYRPPPRGKAVFVSALGGNAKLQFELESNWIPLPGTPHLVPAVFPEHCLVLNRRAAPRLETPVGANYSATFSLAGRDYELPLFDFSEGGIGMRGTPEQCLGLSIGKKLNGVQLQLGPALRIEADLEIRLMRPFYTFLLGHQVQIGCAFNQISMQMQDTLQRFVTNTLTRRAAAPAARTPR